MRHFRRPWVWVVRFRHRRGYGVHSPFAFGFIRDVVYERWPYYAFARLAHLHSWQVRLFGGYPLQCCRMLFRVANYVHPSTFRLIGSMSIERDYIKAAVPTACQVEQGVADLVVVEASRLSEAAQMLSQMAAGGAMILEGIHCDRLAKRMWRAIQEDKHTGITFDLYDYGIVFFDHTRTKQHYIVNF